MDKKLLEILVCPLCKGKLLLKNQSLFVNLIVWTFPIHADIPVMLEHEARVISLEEKDKL